MTSRTTFALRPQIFSETNVGTMSRGASTTRMGAMSRGASTTTMGPKSRGASTTTMGLKSAMASRSKLALRRRPPPRNQGILSNLRYQMEEFFTPDVILYLSAVTCAILIFTIIWIGSLYNQKLKRANVQTVAINRMLDYAVTLQPSLKEKNGTEKMMHLQRLAEVLAVWALKTIELEDAIDDLDRKLFLEWMLHKQVLYFFGQLLYTWEGARRFCESERSLLVYVESEAEERFVEKNTRSAHQDSWIGLFRAKEWEWVDGEKHPIRYWRLFSPVKDAGDCAILQANCIPKKCWSNLPCNSKKRPICKMKPEKKWFD